MCLTTPGCTKTFSIEISRIWLTRQVDDDHDNHDYHDDDDDEDNDDLDDGDNDDDFDEKLRALTKNNPV